MPSETFSFADTMFYDNHDYLNMDPKNPKFQAQPVGAAPSAAFWEEDDNMFANLKMQSSTSSIYKYEGEDANNNMPPALDNLAPPPSMKRMVSMVGRDEGFELCLDDCDEGFPDIECPPRLDLAFSKCQRQLSIELSQGTDNTWGMQQGSSESDHRVFQDVFDNSSSFDPHASHRMPSSTIRIKKEPSWTGIGMQHRQLTPETINTWGVQRQLSVELSQGTDNTWDMQRQGSSESSESGHRVFRDAFQDAFDNTSSFDFSDDEMNALSGSETEMEIEIPRASTPAPPKKFTTTNFSLPAAEVRTPPPSPPSAPMEMQQELDQLATLPAPQPVVPIKTKPRRGRARRSTAPVKIDVIKEINISLKALTDKPSDLHNTAEDNTVSIGKYTKAVRRAKIERYKRKRTNPNLENKVSYTSRRKFANNRRRVGGRFVKIHHE